MRMIVLILVCLSVAWPVAGFCSEAKPAIQYRITIANNEDKVVFDRIVAVDNGVIQVEGFTVVKMIREGGDLPKTYTQIAREIMYKGGTKGWNVRVAPGFMPRSGTKVVAVGGQVRKPGLVDLNTGLTLWEAVNRAGGATQWASMRKVNVIRDGWERRFNLTSLKWTSFPLQDGDVVEVMFKDFMGDGGSPKHAWD